MTSFSSGSTRTPTSERPVPLALEHQLDVLRAQLVEQRGFRLDQLRMLTLARLRTGANSTRASREITASLLVGARSALRDVTAALQRMDAGTYGLCTSCVGAIPVERLEVLPQVAMCMPCQRASDLKSDRS